MLFRRWATRCTARRSSRNGLAKFENTCKATNWWCPPDQYFAMGDNRDHSLDSRYWGFVDRDAIMGRPFLIYWSVNATSADYGQSTFAQRLRSVFDTLGASARAHSLEPHAPHRSLAAQCQCFDPGLAAPALPICGGVCENFAASIGCYAASVTILVKRLRKWWKPGLASCWCWSSCKSVSALLVEPVGARVFLTRQLETSFGRTVDVRAIFRQSFSQPATRCLWHHALEKIRPSAMNISCGRTDCPRDCAGWDCCVGDLNWARLQLERPSLILARNSEGRWNLERWLPAASANQASAVAANPGSRATPAHGLQKMEISDGRVEFQNWRRQSFLRVYPGGRKRRANGSGALAVGFASGTVAQWSRRCSWSGRYVRVEMSPELRRACSPRISG